MMAARQVVIEPITRLEGHGKITIFLDEKGDVENAYFQVPELRGFERFCEGRRAEFMPDITSRICGVCPVAHHTASTKALDDLFGLEPTPTARKIRELMYCAFYIADHSTIFYALSAPDFVVGPQAPKAERNIVGVLRKVGAEAEVMKSVSPVKPKKYVRRVKDRKKRARKEGDDAEMRFVKKRSK